MNLEYKPKDLKDKLERLNNLIACYQTKESKDKVIVKEFEPHKGNPQELFALAIVRQPTKEKPFTIHELKTDYHPFEVLNVYISGFFSGLKVKKGNLSVYQL